MQHTLPKNQKSWNSQPKADFLKKCEILDFLLIDNHIVSWGQKNKEKVVNETENMLMPYRALGGMSLLARYLFDHWYCNWTMLLTPAHDSNLINKAFHWSMSRAQCKAIHPSTALLQAFPFTTCDTLSQGDQVSSSCLTQKEPCGVGTLHSFRFDIWVIGLLWLLY